MLNPSPEHMDRWSRNERLYCHFLSAGLYVTPIFADKEHARIDYLHVAVDLPISQQAPESSVVAPVEGAEIINSVGTPGRCRDGVVISFPPVV